MTDSARVRGSLGRERLALLALAVLDVVVCLSMLLRAALGHSADAILLAPAFCTLATVLIIGFPVAGYVAYRWSRRRWATRAAGVVGVAAAFTVLAGLLLILGLARMPGMTATVVDAGGHPVSGAFVLYQVRPRQPCAVSHVGSLRTDEAGRFTVRAGAHVHVPFSGLFAKSRLQVAVYAPALHVFADPDDLHPRRRGKMETRGTAADPVFVLRDLKGDPEAWYDSLWLLLYATPDRNFVVDLSSALRDDFALFAKQYGSAVRDYERVGARAPEDDWIKWDGTRKTWDFFLSIPWYGETMGHKIGL